jgi:hypothetical protein
MRVRSLALLGLFALACSSSKGGTDGPSGGSGGASADTAAGGAGGAGSGGAGGAGGQPADAARDVARDGSADGAAPDAARDTTADAARPIDGGSACQMLTTIDKSCTTDGDCLAVRHISNCCGQLMFLGIRASELARYNELENACDLSYPLCGCAAGPPITQDGSNLEPGNQKPSVMCLRGTCMAFAPACGHPCEGGTSCVTCTDHLTIYASCSNRCSIQTDCGPNLTCTDTPSGRYCIGPGIACNTR